MAKTTIKKRMAISKARRKKNAPKQQRRRLVDIKILTDHPKIQELLKTPEFKERFEKTKGNIIAGYNLLKTPPFCKILKDDKTGLVILLEVQPHSGRYIHKLPATVNITTMVGRIKYVETADFKNLRRACEYVNDFDQKQSARFTESAINVHSKDMINHVISELSPMLDKFMRPNHSNDQKEVRLPYKAEAVKLD
jgi:hypothetical protein